MIRLPADVVRALRHRAARSGLTIVEAARQLMLEGELKGRHGTIEHVVWLRDRLHLERKEIEQVFAADNLDATSVQQAIDGLTRLQDAWTRIGEDAQDEALRMFYALSASP